MNQIYFEQKVYHMKQYKQLKFKKRREIMVSWLCSKCGYTLDADTPPDECPSCKSDCSFVDNSCYTPDCAGKPNDPQVKGGE